MLCRGNIAMQGVSSRRIATRAAGRPSKFKTMTHFGKLLVGVGKRRGPVVPPPKPELGGSACGPGATLRSAGGLIFHTNFVFFSPFSALSVCVCVSVYGSLIVVCVKSPTERPLSFN